MPRRVRIALLQVRAFDLAQAAEAFHHLLDRLDDAARARPDLAVLPEMAYPAYYLGGPWPDGAPRPAQALAAFAERARQHGMHIAAGMALETADGGLENGLALLGPDGAAVGSYAKSFLWHFDRHWFTRGERYPVFGAAFGRVGALICADARLPEIARLLAVDGASLLVDSTAWVSWGRSPQELSSPQPEYMLRVRARENGAWAVAADKVGVEADSIVYCGRSCVIAPDGTVVATASPDREETLVVDVDLGDGPRLPVERRPELYGRLVEPTEGLPARQALLQPRTVAHESRRLAAVSLAPRPAPAFVDEAERYALLLGRQDCDLAVFSWPGDAEPADVSPGVIERLCAASADGPSLVVPLAETADRARYRTLHLFERGRLVARHRQSHLLPADAGFTAGDEAPPVVETRAGRLGLLAGAEGLAPEVARCLMLDGADVIAWSFGTEIAEVVPLVRCRADENRVYLAAAGAPPEGAFIVAPDGRLLASSLTGREMAVSAQANPALAAWKDMAPGTNVLLDRQPESYGPLIAR